MTIVGEERRLFERRLFECGNYSSAASDRANTIYDSLESVPAF